MKKKSKGIEMSACAPSSDSDYRAEDDHRTLTRAEEVRSDAGRMRGVVKHQKKTERALSRVGRTFGRAGRSR